MRVIRDREGGDEEWEAREEREGERGRKERKGDNRDASLLKNKTTELQSTSYLNNDRFPGVGIQIGPIIR